MDPTAQIPNPPPPVMPAGWIALKPSGMRSKLVMILVPIGIGILVLSGLAVLSRNIDAYLGAGKIVFTTTDPTGYDGCKITDKVATVTAGTEVWMVINFTSTMDKSVVTVSVTKDGQPLDDWSYDVADTEKADCFGDVDPFTDLEPGTYKFTAKRGDKMEADGTLTVK